MNILRALMLGKADRRTIGWMDMEVEQTGPYSLETAVIHQWKPASSFPLQMATHNRPVVLLNQATELSVGSQPADHIVTAAMQMSQLFPAPC